MRHRVGGEGEDRVCGTTEGLGEGKVPNKTYDDDDDGKGRWETGRRPETMSDRRTDTEIMAETEAE